MKKCVIRIWTGLTIKSIKALTSMATPYANPSSDKSLVFNLKAFRPLILWSEKRFVSKVTRLSRCELLQSPVRRTNKKVTFQSVKCWLHDIIKFCHRRWRLAIFDESVVQFFYTKGIHCTYKLSEFGEELLQVRASSSRENNWQSDGCVPFFKSFILFLSFIFQAVNFYFDLFILIYCNTIMDEMIS